MSYDLRIYTIQKLNFSGLLNQFNITIIWWWNGAEIPEELYQPGRRDGSISKVMEFTDKYPKIWTFDGPKAD